MNRTTHDMNNKKPIVTFETVRDKIVVIRGQQVILDYAVAELYGVETREINQAVKNNPNKFPEGWMFELDRQESTVLRSKILMLNPEKGSGKHSKHNYKAFTERGLYMLATILKGEQATATTIAIVDTFAKIRELSQTIKAMTANPDESQQKSLMKKSGDVLLTRKDYIKSLKKIIKDNSHSVIDEDAKGDYNEVLTSFLLFYQSLLETLDVEEVYIPLISIHEGLVSEYAINRRLIPKTHDFDSDVISAAWAICIKYGCDRDHVMALEEKCLKLYDALKKRHGMDKRERLLLQVAAILHDVGKFISLAAEAKSCLSVILNSEIMGLSIREIQIVAYVCYLRAKGLNSFDEVKEILDKEDFVIVLKLFGILMMAGQIDTTYGGLFNEVSYKFDGERTLYITVDTPLSLSLERGIMAENVKSFEDIFSIKCVTRKKQGR